MSINQLRELPSVHNLLLDVQDLVEVEGHARVVEAVRQTLDMAREAVRSGGSVPDRQDLIQAVRRQLYVPTVTERSALINATGVIIHTNLGRAVLSRAAQQAMLAVASDYSPLEFDTDSGERGRRGREVEQLLCKVTGAESALVVNNCAAATVLMLSAVAHGKAVVISRGQLVEIGGGFRIPEILLQSGATLVEIGTTNRTRRGDYEQALQQIDNIGAILRVHSSNFRIVGFTESVQIDELVEVASRAGSERANPETEYAVPVSMSRSAGPFIRIPVLDDVGSGALLDTASFGLIHEPMPQESVRAGADIVTFSGDKLMGGPQAGLIVGRGDMVERCRRHPLARAFRADKYTLAALGATALHYLRGEAIREIPVWRMIALGQDDVRRRAQRCVERLDPWLQARSLRATIVAGESTVGGGSLPGETLPTALIALQGGQPAELAKQLRMATTPVITRIRDDQVLLDLRTVFDDDALIAAVSAC
ncbi:MAG: L-seryl-tRNA(Sec) selenium transferase [Chloroflexi bacterium]|nr:L-seryl-tRNA(Sec) selenium transferase [Chloroflexota bacterium]